jgi:hypothetical protein
MLPSIMRCNRTVTVRLQTHNFFQCRSRTSAFWKEDRMMLTKRITKHSSICSVGGLLTRLSKASRPIVGPSQPPIPRISTAPSLRIKCLVREARLSASSSTEVTNAWSGTFFPPYVVVAWCLIEYRDTFIFIVVIVLRVCLDSWW